MSRTGNNTLFRLHKSCSWNRLPLVRLESMTRRLHSNCSHRLITTMRHFWDTGYSGIDILFAAVNTRNTNHAVAVIFYCWRTDLKTIESLWKIAHGLLARGQSCFNHCCICMLYFAHFRAVFHSGRITILQISINGNPWRCDKSLSWIRAGQEQGILFRNECVMFIVVTRVVCAKPPEMRGMSLDHLGKCTFHKTRFWYYRLRTVVKLRIRSHQY